jgi:hypothetical protein
MRCDAVREGQRRAPIATQRISPGLQLGRASTSLVHYALLVQAARLLRTVGASAAGAGSSSGASIARVVREDADGNAISDSEGRYSASRTAAIQTKPNQTNPWHGMAWHYQLMNFIFKMLARV